jgi:hypothetical protein
MTVLQNNSYERVEELPEERRMEKQWEKFEELEVNQPESLLLNDDLLETGEFFKTALAWSIISNSDI